MHVMPMAVHGRLIAAAPRLTLQWLRETQGPEAEGRAVAGVARRTGIDLHRATKEPWVPFGLQLALLDTLQADGMSLQHFQALGRYNAAHVEAVMPGAGFLLKLATPPRILRAAPVLWRTYADFGTIQAECTAHHGALRLTGVPGHPGFCASLQGLFSGLLERVGVDHGAVEHPQCSCQGFVCCVFEGRWT